MTRQHPRALVHLGETACECLLRMRGHPRLVLVRRLREQHCPWRARSVTRPQSSPLMKLPSRPNASPSGISGATKSVTSSQRLCRDAGEDQERHQHAEEAAVEAHAALPERDDLDAGARGSTSACRTGCSRGGRRGSRRRRRRTACRRRRAGASRSAGSAARVSCRTQRRATNPTRYISPYQRTASGPR